MERNEISVHEARFFAALVANREQWLTSKDLAEKAAISGRTARAHALKLVRLGIVDQAEVFPAHRYRLSDKAAKRNVGYTQRLQKACEVFGLTA